MNVLGIGCYYHDASASLIRDGICVAAAEEERFTRKKHDNSFPINAIRWCLESEGLKPTDIDCVAFYEKPFLKFERIVYQYLDTFPYSFFTFAGAMPSYLSEKVRIKEVIKKRIPYEGEIFFVEHHIAHAASAFFSSPFQRAAILTIDGVGEWTTTAYGVGEKNKIILNKEIRFPSSIGLLYSTITAYLGFSVNNSEYKVMGLAAYGNMNKEANPYYKKLLSIIDIKSDGSYRLDMEYFSYLASNKMPSKKLCDLLGGPVRRKNEEITQRHKDIAAAVQLITEEVISRILNHLFKETKCTNLVMAGGVALNSVYNGKILSRTPFKDVWIQPNASDGGGSLGAALFIYNSVFSQERKYEMKTAYLGPNFSNEQILAFLQDNDIKFTRFTSKREKISKTAKLIYENNIVGWFQGRMEWGPRALGARSILSNPCNPQMKNILNMKVKHRELFRPFAPVVCEDDAPKYFDCDYPIPKPTDFMLMVYPIKENWRSKIPAVTHVDGSGRLQTIRRYQNEEYYDLIKEFGKLSGIPILINTSFNIRGEPIVCTPYDAFMCFTGTGIDYLVLEDYLIKKEDNLEFEWDSEKYADD
ncbi:MAG: carbamoyltransferase [Candidatus Anstonellales archaeon]